MSLVRGEGSRACKMALASAGPSPRAQPSGTGPIAVRPPPQRPPPPLTLAGNLDYRAREVHSRRWAARLRPRITELVCMGQGADP